MKKSSEKLSVGFLFDDTLDSNDGVAQYVKVLGGWLSSQGHDVTYLVGETKLSNWQGGQVYSLARNLRVIWGGNRLSISLLPKLGLIKRVLKERSFDILHVQAPYSPFMAQIVINKASDRTAVVGTFHAFPANRLAVAGSKLLRVIYGRSLKRFNVQISVSQAACSYADQAFGVNSVVIPNVVDIKKFRADAITAKNSSQKIVFLGRLVKRKGCLELLKAFVLLQQSIPAARLVIAGDGPQRQRLEKFVMNRKLQDKVKFLGFIDEDAKPELLASANIACFPSMYGESFGIVLIEAMASGAGVVIGGNNPGYASVLGAQPNLLIDPTNSRSFAARLNELLSDEAEQARLHVWQQKEVQKYDINIVGAQITNVYMSAIARLNKKSNN